MRLDLAGLKRQLKTRPLICEPLEQRALLASLIAAVDIAPVPVPEFAAQAKLFVESALDQVSVMQHQTPIGATVDSSTEVADDGQTVRITNYTVELDDPLVRSPSQLLTQDVQSSVTNEVRPVVQVDSFGTGSTSTSLADRRSSSTSRSNLIFSFTIFPDNSVTIRARLSNPVQWAGLGINQTKDLRQSDNRWTPVESESAWRTSSWQAIKPIPALARNGAVPHGKSNDQHQDSLEVKASMANKFQLQFGRDRELAAEAEFAGGAIKNSTLLEQWIEIESAESDLPSKHRVQSSVVTQQDTFNASNAHPINDNGTWHNGVWQVGPQVNVTDIPVPLGMVPLELEQPVNLQRVVRDVTSHASAIYQVFVHASDPIRNQTFLLSEQHLAWSERLGFSPVEGIEPSRWQNSTLVIVILSSGLVLARRSNRRDQDQLDAGVARTSTVPG